jgi:hypothetical protein
MKYLLPIDDAAHDQIMIDDVGIDHKAQYNHDGKQLAGGRLSAGSYRSYMEKARCGARISKLQDIKGRNKTKIELQQQDRDQDRDQPSRLMQEHRDSANVSSDGADDDDDGDGDEDDDGDGSVIRLIPSDGSSRSRARKRRHCRYFLGAVIANRVFEADRFRVRSYELRQWIEYMVYAGVEKIYWYDTAHDDDEAQEQTLAAYIAAGLVTYHR